MHDTLLLQVAHALGHLAGEVQQDGQAQGPALGACGRGQGQQSGGRRLPGDIPLCLRLPICETGRGRCRPPGLQRALRPRGPPEAGCSVGDWEHGRASGGGGHGGLSRVHADPVQGLVPHTGPQPPALHPAWNPTLTVPPQGQAWPRPGTPSPLLASRPQQAGVCAPGQQGVAARRPRRGAALTAQEGLQAALAHELGDDDTGSPAEHTACSRMRRSWRRLLSVWIFLARSASFMLAEGGRGEAQGPPPPPGASLT